MPSFYVDDVDISVSEFVNACNRKEKDDLIKTLKINGYLDVDQLPSPSKMSTSEQIFEDHLTVLHGKWNRLSNEEEEIIMNIAKKFL